MKNNLAKLGAIKLNFEKQFLNYKEEFEKYLNQYIDSLKGVPSKLVESIKYSLLSGGKRIRPVLMLAFCDLLGGNKEMVYPFACALEMIHTYSLIHDDLPCMDDDQMRRGKPCNHIAFGESTAVLAGDALLTQAFEIVSSNHEQNDFCLQKLKSINILAKCSGSSGMVGGQIIDLNIDLNSSSLKNILELYTMKTAMLFSASAQIGAIMAGADDKKISGAKIYGEKIGIAFQISDDISDNENEILDFFKFETPEKYVEKISNEAKLELQKIGGNTDFLNHLADYLTKRSIV